MSKIKSATLARASLPYHNMVKGTKVPERERKGTNSFFQQEVINEITN
jgi:hypothetical protein